MSAGMATGRVAFLVAAGSIVGVSAVAGLAVSGQSASVLVPTAAIACLAGLVALARVRAWSKSAQSLASTQAVEVDGLKTALAAAEQEAAELREKYEEVEAHQTKLEQALDHAEIQTAMHDHASRRFQSLFAGLPVGCMTFDEMGQVMEWNERMTEIFETPAHSVLLSPVFMALKAVEDPTPIMSALGNIMEAGEQESVEWTIEGSQGTKHVRLYFFPLRNQDGVPVGGICSAIDVTAETVAERHIREMALFQEAILDSTDYSIVSTDPEGIITGFNKAAENLFGYRADRVIGSKHVTSLHTPEQLISRAAEEEDADLDCPECLFRTLIRGTESGQAFETEWEFVLANGSVVDGRVSASGLHDADDVLTGYLFVGKDITDEKAVAERIRMLSLVAEQASSGVAIMCRTGLVTYVNRAFEQITGTAANDVLGDSPFGFRIGSTTDEVAQETLFNALKTASAASIDIEFCRPDGTSYWSSVRVAPIRDASGAVSHIVSIEEDTTDRKAAELAVLASEQRFRDIVEAAGEYIWETDVEFRYTYVSDQVEEVLGYGPKQIVGSSFLEWLPPSETKRVKNLIADSMLGAKGFNHVLIESTHRDGSTVWQKINAVPFFDKAGSLVGFRGAGLDITAQKAAEDAARAANEQVVKILESIKDSFYSLDANLRFTYVNQAAAANFPGGEEALIGKHIWDVNSEDFWKPLRDLFARVQKRSEPESIEISHPPTMTWIAFRAYPNASGGVSVFYQDITDRVMQTRQLEDNMAALNEANLALEMQQAQLEVANSRLMALASTDGLTGLKNHKTFQEFLSEHFNVSETTGKALSVVLMDVDKFKVFNDSFGHLAGDDVLKKVAKTLIQVVKEPHMVARYGGEEFVMVFVGVDEEEAIAYAEEARQAIESQNWAHRQVTASFGVAMYRPEIETKQDLIDRADKALYVSKENGRNQVTLFSSATPSRGKQPEAA